MQMVMRILLFSLISMYMVNLSVSAAMLQHIYLHHSAHHEHHEHGWHVHVKPSQQKQNCAKHMANVDHSDCAEFVYNDDAEAGHGSADEHCHHSCNHVATSVQTSGLEHSDQQSLVFSPTGQEFFAQAYYDQMYRPPRV